MHHVEWKVLGKVLVALSLPFTVPFGLFANLWMLGVVNTAAHRILSGDHAWHALGEAVAALGILIVITAVIYGSVRVTISLADDLRRIRRTSAGNRNRTRR